MLIQLTKKYPIIWINPRNVVSLEVAANNYTINCVGGIRYELISENLTKEAREEFFL